MAEQPLFNRVAFIGIGLIGSSMARVMRRDKLAGSIVACARRQETLDACLKLGIADEVTSDYALAVKNADLVVIASPISTNKAIAKAIAPHPLNFLGLRSTTENSFLRTRQVAPMHFGLLSGSVKSCDFAQACEF